MSQNAIVETRKLTKIYRDFWGRQKKTALRALNLEIRQGEIFGLLGPNGSGKTTTIKLLLGLLFPTDGEAFVFGQPAADVRQERDKSAICPRNRTCTASSTPRKRSISTAGSSTCRPDIDRPRPRSLSKRSD